MKTVTIKDVAERAGVSPKTVSRVINDEVHVRPEVREQVMRVVAELDYRPNAFARGLSSAKSFLIGMFFDDPASVYAADLQRGALIRCRALSHHLLIEQVDRVQPDWMARLDATLRTVKLARLASTRISRMSPLRPTSPWTAFTAVLKFSAR